MGAVMKTNVTVCGTGRHSEAMLEWTERPPWSAVLSIPGVEPLESSGDDLFECLIELRERAAESGHRICVVGARRDAWPSAMSSDMGGAALVYVHRLGRQADGGDLQPIFADAPCDCVGSIEEQREFMAQWRTSLRK
jgi:hypothetical protein